MTKILDIESNTDEWLTARLDHYCASEAPAMMNESKFMSRNQLLDLKKGWKSNPHSSFKEQLFKRGHDHEDQARLILEMETLEDWPPLVASIKIDCLLLLASFDGLNEGEPGNLIWEHKDWNAKLAENTRNGVLEPHYYWQLEHQMIVNQSKSVKFCCSDGTDENRVENFYFSEKERREALLEGWLQFDKDLENHELEAKIEKVEGALIQSLPVLSANVVDKNIISNVNDYIQKAKMLQETQKNKTLESDKDFADTELLNKNLKKSRVELKSVAKSILSQFESVDKFTREIEELDTTLKVICLSGEKQVKTEKERKKNEVSSVGKSHLEEYQLSLEDRIYPLMLNEIYSDRDLKLCMKNKRNLESIQNAVDSEIAKYEIEMDNDFNLKSEMLKHYNEIKEKDLFENIGFVTKRMELGAFLSYISAKIETHKKLLERDSAPIDTKTIELNTVNNNSDLDDKKPYIVTVTSRYTIIAKNEFDAEREYKNGELHDTELKVEEW